LADYYRNSLSGGADIIPLKEELKITLDYLELQKLRYSDVFNYRIEVSEQLEGIMIPKLSLQPIVENAIEHGFKYMSEPGLIRIYDNPSDDQYQIILTDNGVGMAPSLVGKLNAMFDSALDAADHQGVKSFGIKNVNHRLKLFFGDDYGIQVVSTDGEGTAIVIKLPKEVTHD
jgi:two-component system sensor histidine kinase YesM